MDPFDPCFGIVLWIVYLFVFGFFLGFFCHPMPSPYIVVDSNHISLQLLAKCSEPDFLAHCLCDSSCFSWTPSSAFFSACSSLSASSLNKKQQCTITKRSLSHQCAALFPVTLISAFLCSVFSKFLFNISFPCLPAFLGLCFLLALPIPTCSASFLHCCFSHRKPK